MTTKTGKLLGTPSYLGNIRLLSGSCERMENLCGIAKTIFPQWPEAIWVEWGVHVPQIIPGQTDMGPAKRRDVFGDFGMKAIAHRPPIRMHEKTWKEHPKHTQPHHEKHPNCEAAKGIPHATPVSRLPDPHRNTDPGTVPWKTQTPKRLPQRFCKIPGLRCLAAAMMSGFPPLHCRKRYRPLTANRSWKRSRTSERSTTRCQPICPGAGSPTSSAT